MKRLIINSLLNAAVLALAMYVILGTFALSHGGVSVFLEMDLIGVSAFLGALRLLVMLPVDVSAVPAYRRLQRQFVISDRFPGQPECWRSVALLVPWSDFAKSAQAMITDRLRTYSITEEREGASIALAVNYGYGGSYRITLTKSGDGIVRLSVRNTHPLAPLIVVDLAAAQLLAGVIWWAAGTGVIARDYTPLVAPEQLEKDMGDWLSTSDASTLSSVAPTALKLYRPHFPVRAFLTRGAIFLGAFLGLYVVNRFKIVMVPLAIQLLPLFLLAIYVTGQIVRTSAKSPPQTR